MRKERYGKLCRGLKDVTILDRAIVIVELI